MGNREHLVVLTLIMLVGVFFSIAGSGCEVTEESLCPRPEMAKGVDEWPREQIGQERLWPIEHGYVCGLYDPAVKDHSDSGGFVRICFGIDTLRKAGELWDTIDAHADPPDRLQAANGFTDRLRRSGWVVSYPSPILTYGVLLVTVGQEMRERGHDLGPMVEAISGLLEDDWDFSYISVDEEGRVVRSPIEDETHRRLISRWFYWRPEVTESNFEGADVGLRLLRGPSSIKEPSCRETETIVWNHARHMVYRDGFFWCKPGWGPLATGLGSDVSASWNDAGRVAAFYLIPSKKLLFNTYAHPGAYVSGTPHPVIKAIMDGRLSPYDQEKRARGRTPRGLR